MNNMKKNQYLSDVELERLIAITESEPMLHPPGEFKDDILGRVRRKRENRKNLRLFSYSVKVFAATAAALTLILILPENIRSEESFQKHMAWEDRMQEEEEQTYNGDFMYRLNEKMDNYCSQLNTKLNQLVGMEDY